MARPKIAFTFFYFSLYTVLHYLKSEVYCIICSISDKINKCCVFRDFILVLLLLFKLYKLPFFVFCSCVFCFFFYSCTHIVIGL
jgi:hypothetical protein